MMVAVGVVEHRYGTDCYVGETEKAVRQQLAVFCRDWWHEARDVNADLPEEPYEDDNRAVLEYFDAMANACHAEFYTIVTGVDVVPEKP